MRATAQLALSGEWQKLADNYAESNPEWA